MEPKTRHHQQYCQCGFITLEIMIALALMILSVTAVAIVAFQNQDTLVSAETTMEATQKAQEVIEMMHALGRKDLNLVNPMATTTGIYRTALSVEPVSITDYFSKKITARVAWTNERHVLREVLLTSIVTDFLNGAGGDTCSSALSDGWQSPRIANTTTDFAQLIGRAGETFSLTDLDVYKGKLYVTAGHAPNQGDPTFFVFDISNPLNPVFLSNRSLDNAPTTVNGLASVAVGERYAYVASSHGANFNTCTNTDGQNTACAQFQIADIVNASPAILYSFKVPGVISTNGGVGKSIFYQDGYVYLGLTSSGGNGPEFNIIDVHNFPTTPPALVGSYTIGAGVNTIVVKNNYAYLATGSSGATLTILNVSDRANPVLAWNPVSSSFGNGKSATLAPDKIYLGKTADPNTGELYVFNNPNPAGTQPTLASTTEIGSTINDIRTRDYLTFFLTNTDIQIWNATSSAHQVLAIPGAGSTQTNYRPFFDCERNVFYVGGNNTSNQGSLSVITSAP